MNEIAAKISCLSAITEVSLMYGAREQVSKIVYAECVALMLSKFPHLGVEEIKEAYRANASGELETKGKGEMWGGQFNAANFAAIMAAYSTKRRGVVAAYTNEMYEAEQAAAAAKWHAQKKREFDDNFEKTLRDLAAAAASFKDCPEYLFHSCKRRGMIEITSEDAHLILADAEKVFRAAVAAGDVPSVSVETLLDLSNAEQVRVIARKMTLWQYVIAPMKMEV